MILPEKTYDACPYDSRNSHPLMSLGVNLDLCLPFVQTAVKISGLQNLSDPTIQLNFNKMVQRLAVTYSKNVRIDPLGENPWCQSSY